ncbi:MAG: hypothetical protein IPM54_44730 [Polyangiaceae bacterium]|nr:hypothetical protein [Polyangiaceae bacterium]
MRKAHFWPWIADGAKLARPPFVGGTIEGRTSPPDDWQRKVEAEQWRMGITW